MTEVYLLNIEVEDGEYLTVHSTYERAEQAAREYMRSMEQYPYPSSGSFSDWIVATDYNEDIHIAEMKVDAWELDQ